MNNLNERDIEQSLQRMKKTCKVIRCCFLIATIIYAILWVSIIVLAALEASGKGFVSHEAVYAFVGGLFTALILWNLFRLFDEIDKGGAPFSFQQAGRLQQIAIIALAYVALDFIISFGFMFNPVPELGFAVVFNNGIAEPTLNLNVGMLAFSAIMYSLSAIFRYAALLQQLSDDTV
ncbi:DUF2975 domain-containing protein [Adlercreutzia sp. R25]|uniref:DUF2975 domain-containing protein n=1 Tax=Adlercreutzia shanghongiae TaxID=3111773 RepID=A0ABU6IV41_9ACTN|nr:MULTISPECIES: DUF2975 domain-containing protein [unclassified Adlercreutzia]MEC4271965.1 DUF2975 domain-containing protein [Adlercreutzia sp. R25]MEC4293696.1 DUF2975 domain-containing protein [Adlercreutzia sp. R22]